MVQTRILFTEFHTSKEWNRGVKHPVYTPQFHILQWCHFPLLNQLETLTTAYSRQWHTSTSYICYRRIFIPFFLFLHSFSPFQAPFRQQTVFCSTSFSSVPCDTRKQSLCPQNGNITPPPPQNFTYLQHLQWKVPCRVTSFISTLGV